MGYNRLMDLLNSFPGSLNGLTCLLGTKKYQDALNGFCTQAYLDVLVMDIQIEDGNPQIVHHLFSEEPGYDILSWNGECWIEE